MRILVDWGSRRQGAVAKSTAEAELIAVVDSLTRSSLPMLSLLEEILQRVISFVHEIDNSAAETVTRTGTTKEMKYMRKTQRISESWAQEQLFGSKRKDRSTLLVSTKDNLADLFTKALDKDTHWKFVNVLNMMEKAEFKKMVVAIKKNEQ